ncbi:MAG: GGDEF domain-containing protein [Firmicutes bacterium]|nr:GGDEF domain-containing protein [Bacillota bacterium]
MFNLYTAASLITAMILIITVADAVTNQLIEKNIKNKTIIACSVILVAALGECIGVLTNGAPEAFLLLHKIAKVMEFSCAPFIGLTVGMAFGDAKCSKVAIAVYMSQAAFEVIASHYGWVFIIDNHNLYYREELYFIYVLAFLSSTFYGFYCIVRGGRGYQVRTDIVMVLSFCMLAVGIGIQFVFSGIRVDYLCISIVNLMFYLRYNKGMLQVDAVTGLLNRRCYDVNISNIEHDSAVIFFDVDKFKIVNDTYGHSVGDICLQNVAKALQKVYEPHGTCYRTGGDEFTVILTDGIENLNEINEAFYREIKDVQESDGRMPGVTLGYAFYDTASEHIQNVIEAADAMLYKNKGGNCND